MHIFKPTFYLLFHTGAGHLFCAGKFYFIKDIIKFILNSKMCLTSSTPDFQSVKDDSRSYCLA